MLTNVLATVISAITTPLTDSAVSTLTTQFIDPSATIIDAAAYTNNPNHSYLYNLVRGLFFNRDFFLLRPQWWISVLLAIIRVSLRGVAVVTKHVITRIVLLLGLLSAGNNLTDVETAAYITEVRDTLQLSKTNGDISMIFGKFGDMIGIDYEGIIQANSYITYGDFQIEIADEGSLPLLIHKDIGFRRDMKFDEEGLISVEFHYDQKASTLDTGFSYYDSNGTLVKELSRTDNLDKYFKLYDLYSDSDGTVNELSVYNAALSLV